jgi:REP element-mobilizing transposase RayT
MGRGIEKKNIFLKDKDRNDFINRLSALVDEGVIDIYAWAHMPNHFHLLLKIKIRYIHLNLLSGGVVKDINGLNDSPWSGHSALLGKVERKWQDIEYILSYFGNKRVRRKNYYKYVK